MAGLLPAMTDVVGQSRMMPARTRKLIGTIVLLVFLGLYAWAAAAIGAGRVTRAPAWAQFAYFPPAWSSAGCSVPTEQFAVGRAELSVPTVTFNVGNGVAVAYPTRR
jgi:hypothetical protein